MTANKFEMVNRLSFVDKRYEPFVSGVLYIPISVLGSHLLLAGLNLFALFQKLSKIRSILKHL